MAARSVVSEDRRLLSLGSPLGRVPAAGPGVVPPGSHSRILAPQDSPAPAAGRYDVDQHPIRRKLTMSTSSFVVRMAELDAKLDAARKAGDLRGMQALLAEQTSLLRSMYGSPR